MANQKKGTYEYKTMSIYFDVSNPYQKECYELLQKIQKKKSLFLGLLAHEFIKQFKDAANISADDLKNYIQYYDLVNKMDNNSSARFSALSPASGYETFSPNAPLMYANQPSQTAMPAKESIEQKNISIEQQMPMQISNSEKAVDTQQMPSIDKTRAIAAMNFFTAT